MENLILALKIFLKYGNPDHPTHCEHDIMYICGIATDEVTTDDIEKLDKLGFFISESEECFISYKYGSA